MASPVDESDVPRRPVFTFVPPGLRALARSLLDGASVSSIVFVNWMSDLVTFGYQNPLQLTDLPDLPEEENTEVVAALFNRHWREQEDEIAREGPASTRKPSTLTALRRSFSRRMVLGGFFECLYYCTNTILPFVIKGLLSVISSPNSVLPWGAVYCAALFVLPFLSSLSINFKWYNVTRVGVNLRTAIMVAVYAKAMRLAQSSRQASATGETLNLMSNDSNIVFQSVLFLNTIWIAPIIIAVVLALMINELGVSALAGVVMMMLLLPLQSFMATRFGATKYDTQFFSC
jgi:ATP-binding cassette subfamily C (CFTR/MRP) protein 1